MGPGEAEFELLFSEFRQLLSIAGRRDLARSPNGGGPVGWQSRALHVINSSRQVGTEALNITERATGEQGVIFSTASQRARLDRTG